MDLLAKPHVNISLNCGHQFFESSALVVVNKVKYISYESIKMLYFSFCKHLSINHRVSLFGFDTTKEELVPHAVCIVILSLRQCP